MLRQLCCDFLQKGKGKAAAAASQPQLASRAMDTEDGSQVEQDIAVTSELLERFNAHADTWEALEVRKKKRKKERHEEIKKARKKEKRPLWEYLDMRNVEGKHSKTA